MIGKGRRKGRNKRRYTAPCGSHQTDLLCVTQASHVAWVNLTIWYKWRYNRPVSKVKLLDNEIRQPVDDVSCNQTQMVGRAYCRVHTYDGWARGLHGFTTLWAPASFGSRPRQIIDSHVVIHSHATMFLTHLALGVPYILVTPLTPMVERVDPMGMLSLAFTFCLVQRLKSDTVAILAPGVWSLRPSENSRRAIQYILEERCSYCSVRGKIIWIYPEEPKRGLQIPEDCDSVRFQTLQRKVKKFAVLKCPKQNKQHRNIQPLLHGHELQSTQLCYTDMSYNLHRYLHVQRCLKHLEIAQVQILSLILTLFISTIDRVLAQVDLVSTLPFILFDKTLAQARAMRTDAMRVENNFSMTYTKPVRNPSLRARNVVYEIYDRYKPLWNLSHLFHYKIYSYLDYLFQSDNPLPEHEVDSHTSLLIPVRQPITRARGRLHHVVYDMYDRYKPLWNLSHLFHYEIFSHLDYLSQSDNRVLEHEVDSHTLLIPVRQPSTRARGRLPHVVYDIYDRYKPLWNLSHLFHYKIYSHLDYLSQSDNPLPEHEVDSTRPLVESLTSLPLRDFLTPGLLIPVRQPSTRARGRLPHFVYDIYDRYKPLWNLSHHFHYEIFSHLDYLYQSDNPLPEHEVDSITSCMICTIDRSPCGISRISSITRFANTWTTYPSPTIESQCTFGEKFSASIIVI
ncbi:hypothetical protein J6590_017286 [Homalodisca vitripennis]|nr:hypothetical protein J6590_017286 [Homalodisca vitripennis]